jgi:hypothetical protein
MRNPLVAERTSFYLYAVRWGLLAHPTVRLSQVILIVV